MGKLVEIKTKATESSVEEFIAAISDDQKRKDSPILLFNGKSHRGKTENVGASIIGFGILRSESLATGRQIDWFRIGLSPRKVNLTLMSQFRLLKSRCPPK